MPIHNAAKLVFVALMSLTVLGGCSASMQVVRKDAGGGEIAVWGPTVPAAAQARHAMLEHCRGRFAVGAGAETYGLGAADPMLAVSHHSNAATLPPAAQVLTYRCARPATPTESNSEAVALAHSGVTQ